ncbi:hypothetical protein EU245_11630 [Lentibacillus lipolyticus]|nr:hypothetical protein EU245_11630 [Lentibacillus lipolyticus]
MNNRGGMMTSLMALGAAGAAIYGIRKGMQNGTLQRMPQAVSNMMNNGGGQMQNVATQMQQGGATQPAQQQPATQMKLTAGTQDKQEQMGYRKNSQ